MAKSAQAEEPLRARDGDDDATRRADHVAAGPRRREAAGPAVGLSFCFVMTLSRVHRRAVGLVTLAAWLFALACTSVHACDLVIPSEHDCCPTTTSSIDAECSSHCELSAQAPTTALPDVAQAALAAPVLCVVTPALIVRAHPPPDASGDPPPLTLLFQRLRN